MTPCPHTRRTLLRPFARPEMLALVSIFWVSLASLNGCGEVVSDQTRNQTSDPTFVLAFGTDLTQQVDNASSPEPDVAASSEAKQDSNSTTDPGVDLGVEDATMPEPDPGTEAEPEPEVEPEPCSQCWGAENNSCDEACAGFGFDQGECASPDSTDPDDCCICSNELPPLPDAVCGDGVCSLLSESCEDCEEDCGCAPGNLCIEQQCQPVCGDNLCAPGSEDCGICPGDCPCPFGSQCSENQCVADPNAPTAVCGDNSCAPGLEDCGTCPADCLCQQGEICDEHWCVPE